MTTPPTPRPETEHPPPAQADLDRLAAEVEARKARAPQPRPEPARPDFEAWGRQVAERSRPVRQQADAERTARQRRIDGMRRERVIATTLDRLDRRFDRFAEAALPPGTVARWAIAVGRGQRRDGLVIAGPVGTGKTHQAVAAYRHAVRHGVLPAVAVAVPALLDGLRPGREPVETLEACESARLLLLDDLAAERSSDWTAEVLYRLIDARYARRLPTIITTNATGAMIRASLGDRVASRLNGLGMTVVLDGPDRRTPQVD